jgi:hypothetical protein
LFGEGSDETRRVYGFLYEAYGPVAWWWEVEELLRRLCLTAVVVLMDPGSPLQVTLAVLFSGWAHVLHAVYKPWVIPGSTAVRHTYMVQHGSLLVTSFVFLMGLLFKVEGVSSKSPVYDALSVVMLLLCVGFMVWWLTAMFAQVCVTVVRRRVAIRNAKKASSGATLSSPSSIVDGDVVTSQRGAGGGVMADQQPLDAVSQHNGECDAVSPLSRRGTAASTTGAVDRRATVVGDGSRKSSTVIMVNPMYVRGRGVQSGDAAAGKVTASR